MFRKASIKKALENIDANSITSAKLKKVAKSKKLNMKKHKKDTNGDQLNTPLTRHSKKKKKMTNGNTSKDPKSLDSAFDDFTSNSHDSLSEDSPECMLDFTRKASAIVCAPETPLLIPMLNELRLNKFVAHSPGLDKEKKDGKRKEISNGPFDDVDDIDSLPGLLMYDSEAEARAYFAWIVMPVSLNNFFSKIWESNVLYVERRQPDYYGSLFSSEELFQAMIEYHLDYTTNINLARYVDGHRETLNPIGRAFASITRDFYEREGCSVQFINPQAYCDKIWTLCDRLQELFGCFVGANTYLTPAGTQGFAPHWDEIDAFIMQLEGRKYWKVYQYKGVENLANVLPRESSRNFTDADLNDWTLVHHGWLNTGDLLYMPRGFIHQGYTDSKSHSFHLTISVGRKHSYADLYEKIMPDVLRSTIDASVDFRHSLPIDMLSRSGVSQDGDYLIQSEPDYWDQSSDTDKVEPQDMKEIVTKTRHLQFYRYCRKLNEMIGTEILKNIDAAVDMQALESMQTMLPPVLTEMEKTNSIYGGGPMPKFKATTAVKFIRKHGQRLIYESENSMRLEHRYHNSRIFEERTILPILIDANAESIVKDLIMSYPEYRTINDLQTPETPLDIKIETVTLLYKNGLLMIETN